MVGGLHVALTYLDSFQNEEISPYFWFYLLVFAVIKVAHHCVHICSLNLAGCHPDLHLLKYLHGRNSFYHTSIPARRMPIGRQAHLGKYLVYAFKLQIARPSYISSYNTNNQIKVVIMLLFIL